MSEVIVFIGQTPTAGGTGGYIYTVKPDGTALTQLSAAGNGWRYASLSPDGTKLLGMKPVGPTSTLFIMAADGSGATALTNIHANTATNIPPAWSPDSTQIVLPYSSSSPAYTPAGITVVNVDNSGHTEAALGTMGRGNANGAVYWSPDGSKIAFPDTNGASGNGVSTCHPDGTSVTSVLSGASYWYDVYGWYANSTDLFIGAMGTSGTFPFVLQKTSTVLYTDATETDFEGNIMCLSPDETQVLFFDVSGALKILDLGSSAMTTLITPPPYPVGGIDAGGGIFFVQWLLPVASTPAGPRVHLPSLAYFGIVAPRRAGTIVDHADGTTPITVFPTSTATSGNTSGAFTTSALGHVEGWIDREVTDLYVDITLDPNPTITVLIPKL